MQERIGQPADQPSPHAYPTAPLNATAKDAMHRLELALTTPDPTVVDKVRAALGFTPGWQPDSHLGETATHLTTWSQMELNDLYERVGGTVTSRQAERTIDDTTWTATEITLTVDVPGVGPVEVVTDLEIDPEHGYRADVPVAAVALLGAAATSCRRLSATAVSADDFDQLLCVQDELSMCRNLLAASGRLDLIEEVAS